MALPTDNGFVSKPSPYSAAETLDRLEELVRAKGMTVFARIDQRAAAETSGLTMRPMQILLFGDPRGGTPLMTAYPSLAIDLPLKALAWEAADGKVWLSYNSPAYLQQRHALPQTPFIAVEALIEKALT